MLWLYLTHTFRFDLMGHACTTPVSTPADCSSARHNSQTRQQVALPSVPFECCQAESPSLVGGAEDRARFDWWQLGHGQPLAWKHQRCFFDQTDCHNDDVLLMSLSDF